LRKEFSSNDDVMTPAELSKTLEKFDLFVRDMTHPDGELLR
jgi:hypothetical protein